MISQLSSQSNPVTFQKPSIEREGSIYKITAKGGDTVDMNSLAAGGKIQSYEKDNDGNLVIFASSPDVADKLVTAENTQEQTKLGFLQKAKDLFIPPNLKENCAPEYLKFRANQIAGSLCCGVINFMTARANLDAINIAFLGSSEKAALAGAITGAIYNLTSMGASYLAGKGDVDPKKCHLIANTLYATNIVGTLAGLALLPQAYIPISIVSSVLLAVGNMLNSAASINVFNHMAKGPAKGLVTTRNSNQDLLAGLVSTPLALGLSRAAGYLGVNPFIFAVATAGAALITLAVQGSSLIRMEALTRANLEKIVNGFIDSGKLPDAEKAGIWSTVKSIFSSESTEYSKKIQFADSLEDVVGKDRDGADARNLFKIFKKESYILNCDKDGMIKIAFTKNADLDCIMRAYMQARLIDKAYEKGFDKKLRELCGDYAPMALVDLTSRIVDKDMCFSKEMPDKGWNPNPAKLDIKKIDAGWISSEDGPRVQIPLSIYKNLIDTTDMAQIKQVMNILNIFYTKNGPLALLPAAA